MNNWINLGQKLSSKQETKLSAKRVELEVSLLAKRVRLANYHRKHKVSATRVLKALESEKGAMQSSLRKYCDEYANDVLGSRVYAPWLYVYAHFSGEFKVGWIPDNYYGACVVPKFSGAYGDVSSLKPLNRLIFNSNIFLM